MDQLPRFLLHIDPLRRHEGNKNGILILSNDENILDFLTSIENNVEERLLLTTFLFFC